MNKLSKARIDFLNLYDMLINNKQIDKYSDENFEFIYEKMVELFDIYKNFNVFDKKMLKQEIDAELQIYQPTGIVIALDEDPIWFTNAKDNIDFFYWGRYKSHLINSGWSINVVNRLENSYLEEQMNLIGDPNSKSDFSKRGLIIGDVQSGKTSNYIGLISMAADAGYKVIVLLTGLTEDLRSQTQIRVEEGFIGYDVENQVHVGVGEMNRTTRSKIPNTFTSRVHDFTGKIDRMTTLNINDEGELLIFITKKNSHTLKKIRTSLKNINISSSAKKRTIDSSLLIIDDESDNASVNTRDVKSGNDPSTINREIRELLNIFSKSSYVGYSATPFANIFIDPETVDEMYKDDLFPRDFIYVIEPPSNYVGPEKIFFDKKYSEVVQTIRKEYEFFPLKHTKDFYVDDLPASLKEAINVFLLANAIRDLREGDKKQSHRSMLINVSRFILIQNQITSLVNEYLDKIVKNVRAAQNVEKDEYMSNDYILDLHKTYMKHYFSEKSWDDVFKNLYIAIKDVKIHQVPFRDKEHKLDFKKYEETGLRTIVIGGLALSRGLTLEGLTVSYLYRNTKTFDVLMQMGRFFGYRHRPIDYSDICRIWMLESTEEFFQEITNSTKQLRADIRRMRDDNKKPVDFGIRVRNESDILQITSYNKMRNIIKYIYASDFYGRFLETPYLNLEKNKIRSNAEQTLQFIKSLNFDKMKNDLISYGVPTHKIISYLQSFDIHESNMYSRFHKNAIFKFIETNGYKDFDVVVRGGIGSKIDMSVGTINSVQRKFDIIRDEIIRMSATKSRLGSPGDTKLGLTSEQLESLPKEGISSETYLIEDRRPIFIIYPVQLKEDEESYSINYIHEMFKENLPLIGVGIGFPNSQNKKQIKEKYSINPKTKWDVVMLESDREEDE